MAKEDGDGDGVVSDIEMLRALYSVTPGLTAEDCGFLIKFLSKRCCTSNSGGGENSAGAALGASKGIFHGISAASVAEWFTAQPGGMPPTAAKKDAEEGEGKDRLAASEKKFLQFRAGWEEKHGAAAKKEMSADAAEPAEGPTWTRATPAPFRVLHLAVPAPPGAGAQ